MMDDHDYRDGSRAVRSGGDTTCNAALLSVAGHALLHSDDGERLAVRQRDIEALARAVTASGVKRDASQCRAHLEAGEAGRDRRGFAGVEDRGADTAARPVRVYE